jgi:ribonuclease Z
VTTTVTLTGTGTPIVVPGLAGPGVLVRHGGVAIQVDVGRGTVMRLGDLGFDLTALTAVLVTHHHSDHMIGLADLLMTRWLEEVTTLAGQPPLPVIVPEGPASRIARHVLDVWEEEIQMRREHTGRPDHPAPDVRAFEPGPEPSEVYRAGAVAVEAVLVDHDPVVPAVGYRLSTPDGGVVVSGDTAICPALEETATEAEVLVHEVFRRDAVEGLLSDPDAIAAYHSEARAVGALASRAAVRRLVLTHCIPPVRDEAYERELIDDVRAGGFEGELVVGRDLATLVF